jgi:hypothetical protein
MMLLLVVDEFMNLCLECCWVMLLMLIHVLGIDICVVVIKLLCLMLFCEDGSQMKKFDFGELG